MDGVLTLSESLGDYLETIYHLIQDSPAARVKDIAARMEVHMSSVTGALKTLGEKNLINHDPYSFVTLTPLGKRTATEIAGRHEILAKFFTDVLGIDEDAAEKNACHMEHTIGPKAFEHLVKFIDFVEQCPRAGRAWTRDFGRFCHRGRDTSECERCIEGLLARIRPHKGADGPDADSTAHNPTHPQVRQVSA